MDKRCSETPVKFDGNLDLSSFDPLASKPDECSADFDVINADVCGETRANNAETFESLSAEEIEKADKMNSELLRRSREVVTTKANAGKTWLERTLSNVSQLSVSEPEPTEGQKVEVDETMFDVVDNTEVEPVMSGSRASAVFRGIRARENYLKLHMAAREKEFTELYPFSVFCGTWNVNGQMSSECLKPWLEKCTSPPDVLAFGFQELDLSAEALVFNDSGREESWLKSLHVSLPKKADYYKLKHIRLVGMLLVVFVQTKHKSQVRYLEAQSNPTGIMGMLGNKGGVAIRFQLHNSTLCFVNSHLAAHLAEFERRNQDFREVYNKLKFTLYQPNLSINDHDLVFWMGDLNYRFDNLDADQVKDLIAQKKFLHLLMHDQLEIQREASNVFQGFIEGPLNFIPTYKYDPGTDNWDSSEKSRAPAWCDRVLWRGKNIEQQYYDHHPQLKLSDHKPVSAFFTVQIKIVDRRNERKVFEEIVRKLDRKENDSLPHVKLGVSEFQFGEMEFMEEKTEILPIANIGQSPVEFEFIPKLDDTNVAKEWIKVNPSQGFVMPGDVFEIELSVKVDKLSAPILSTSNYKLDDILVLHLVDGKDFFVPINGMFKPSVFGCCLETLVRVYGPISQLPLEKVLTFQRMAFSFDTADSAAFDNTEPIKLPKELWLIVDHLYKYGMTQENILVQSGIDEEIIMIRKHLDTLQGGKLPGSIFSVGESLLLFLEALPEPVIPFHFQEQCMDACNNFLACKQVISQLPQCHKNVFRYLIAFLRELLLQSAENKLDAKLIGAVFGSILLRSPLKTERLLNRRSQSQLAQKKAKFVCHFLINEY